MASPSSPETTKSDGELLRRLQHYERWVRMLDGQIRVLERERQKLSAVVNHTDAGFLVFDPSLCVVWANAVASEGRAGCVTPAAMVGKACHEVLCGSAATCADCPAASTFRTRTVAHHEMAKPGDEGNRTLYATSMPVLSPRGEVDQTMVMVQDISDLTVLRRSEQLIRESEGRLRVLVSQMPAILWSTDRDLRFTSSVGAGLGHLELKANEVVGKTLQEYFGTGDPRALPIATHLRALGGEPSTYEMDWKGRTFHSHVEPLYDAGRQIVGTIGAAIDLTDRKAAEEALKQSEARKDAVVRTALDAVIGMSHDGLVTEFNPAAEEMFGWSRDEAIDRPLDRLIARIGNGPADVIGRRIETMALRKDGGEFPVEVAITRVPIVGPPVYTGYIRDLSERKCAEERLRLSEEQLRQSQKLEAIGTLAGGVAHDFNNMLTAILGYTALLKRGVESGESVTRAAEVIEKAAQRGAALTRQLLGFARKGKNQTVAVDLDATIREVLELLSRTIDKRIRIRHVPGGVSPIVSGDPSQIEQVILNLAVNARDAMPDGGELAFAIDETMLDGERAERYPGTQPGPHWRLRISDTGCGIPAEIVGRIFEPFFTTKDRDKGTGMGLAMVYGIVQNHGGGIRVESAVGAGTTVEILLPRGACALAETAAAADDGVRGHGRILVVDDEEAVRDVTADLLRELGYDVATAFDGQDAVEYYERHAAEIDLILIDLVMPRMGGRECFRALKALNPDVRTVLCTGYGFNIAAQELLDEGMTGFLSKPYDFGRLSSVVSRTLAKE
ncbi:MAG TPA: PAS domain S-box protein [Candidatus Polarisedimenticolaceae bacterium]|nr:PAS domain S-box protein [Candidatus Polarisedimenticolaceae bacterium]